MLKQAFNLDEFFDRGFTTSQIETDVADELLAALKNEPFVAPESVFGGDIYDTKEVDTGYGAVVEPTFNVRLKKALEFDWVGSRHPLIWEKGMNGKDDPSLFTSYPEVFQLFWNELVDRNLHWFTKTYGRFSRFGMLAHKYEVGQGLGWHHDLSDSTWVNCILYLGEKEFPSNSGGYLTVAGCSLNKEGIPVMEKGVFRSRTISPSHGTIVFLDNRKPNLLHKVPVLEKPLERYTLSCQLGYIENLMAKKFKKEHD